MNTMTQRSFTRSISSFLFCLLLACSLFLAGTTAHAIVPLPGKSEAEAPPETAPPAPKPVGPVDEFNRGVPKTAFEGFIKYAGSGEFEKAAKYLDLRNLPRWMGEPDGQELAHQLKIVIDRAMWIDLDAISDDPKGNDNDGLPAYRESLGRLETPDKTVDLLLQHVPREDGIYIWKFSNRTVAEIPYLNDHFGYSPFEEGLSEMFPDIIILGWQIWQWVMFLIFIGLSYLAAVIITLLLNLLWKRKESEISEDVTRFIHSPLRFVLWIIGVNLGAYKIGLSTSLRVVARPNTLLLIAITWATIRTIDIAFAWWTDRLLKGGSQAATVLLRPVKTMVRIVIVMTGLLVWLDNIGFNISTLLAGLGVGGVAMALAAQDTLKNFISSILILLDKPYQIGQRIVVQGHDGVVEEIGLRSTRIRLLNGHQTVIPNDKMASVDIENIGRRPYIRRTARISIAYDTPLEKVKRAVEIVQGIIDNHEGMDPERLPRAYFREFAPTSLTVWFIYWYHPPKYWDFMDLNQRVNFQIMEEFEKEGIQLALPITEVRLNTDDEKPPKEMFNGEIDPDLKD